jgi:hypothetical protein
MKAMSAEDVALNGGILRLKRGMLLVVFEMSPQNACQKGDKCQSQYDTKPVNQRRRPFRIASVGFAYVISEKPRGDYGCNQHANPKDNGRYLMIR